MQKAETITSAANPLLKDARRAVERGALTSLGFCVAETFHLLEEAVRSRREIAAVFATESAMPQVERTLAGRSAVRLLTLPDALMESLSATETSQGVVALVEPPVWSLDQLFGHRALVAVLDGLQDPGNAGAVVRAAEAFAASGVLFLKGSVSPFNPKTLRASAGSLFRVPFVHGLDAAEALAAFRANGVQLYAAVPPRGTAPTGALAGVDLTARCAIAIGNEARGVSAALRAAALDLTIPTEGVESLNAAVAAAVLLYEARRQRSLRP